MNCEGLFNYDLDIAGHVIQDFGVVTGTTNNVLWCRRQIRVKQEDAYCNLTLWNNMVEKDLLIKCEKSIVLIRLVSLIEI